MSLTAWKSVLGAALLVVSSFTGVTAHPQDASMRTLKAVRALGTIGARDSASLLPRNDLNLDYLHREPAALTIMTQPND